VARKYCGQLGKQDNCQCAVAVSVATSHASLPVAYRLYAPQEWTADRSRRTRAGIPEEVRFQTKPEIAMEQLRALTKTDTPKGVVLADAGYGNDSEFRRGVRSLSLSYVVGIQKSTKAWPPGTEPLPPPEYSGCGRPPKLPRRSLQHTPVSVWQVAQDLASSAYQTITWREGTNQMLSSRFAAVRVREGHRYYWRSYCPPEESLLIEWPEGESEPTKYWLSNLDAAVSLAELVDTAKLRWRIERDYQELKQEIGLVILRAEAGGDSTIMPPSALPLMGFWWPSAVLFPPPAPTSGQALRYLRYPQVGSQGDPPLRPERHSPSSIATKKGNS
jgi:SRSO17 transposase